MDEPSVRSETVEEISAAIVSAFRVFDAVSPEGALSLALAGEFYGIATFDALAKDSEEADERRFWELSRDVEAVTAKGMKEYFGKAFWPMPSEDFYSDLGRRTARVFAGEPHTDYCAWVAPQIGDAMQSFTRLRDSLDDARLGAEMYDHEAAFVKAWDLLEGGFAVASAPLEAHMAKYGSATRYLGG